METDYMAAGLPQEGLLDEYPIPRLLVLLHEQKSTGMLHIESGKIKTWVSFLGGFPVGVFIPNAEVYLGMILRELGYIDELTFNESLLVMHKTNKLQGRVLIDMGEITVEQLDQALTVQLIRKLTQLFALHEGVFRFADDESMPENLTPMQVHPYRIIYNGIKNNYQTNDLEQALGPLLTEKVCRLSDRFNEVEALLEIPADEKKDIELLREQRLTSEFIARGQSGTSNAMMLLLFLHYCGLLEEEIGPQTNPQMKVPELSPEPAPEPEPEGAKQPKLKPAGRKEKPAPEAKTDRSRKLKKWMEILHEKFEHVKKGNLIEILGVTRDAGSQDIKAAHIKLTKLFHPDRLATSDNQELKKLINIVFAKINEAEKTLCDPDLRKEYLKTLPLKPGEKREFDAPAALIEYEKARVFIKKKNYPDAVKHLQLACELDPQKPDYRAQLIWCRLLNCDKVSESELISARDELKKMHKSVPDNFFVNRFLSSVYQRLKDSANYEMHLKKANNIRPNDIETARDLRLYNMRKSKTKGK
jgi:curved DNA-binding protein CbpA